MSALASGNSIVAGRGGCTTGPGTSNGGPSGPAGIPGLGNGGCFDPGPSLGDTLGNMGQQALQNLASQMLNKVLAVKDSDPMALAVAKHLASQFGMDALAALQNPTEFMKKMDLLFNGVTSNATVPLARGDRSTSSVIYEKSPAPRPHPVRRGDESDIDNPSDPIGKVIEGNDSVLIGGMAATGMGHAVLGYQGTIAQIDLFHERVLMGAGASIVIPDEMLQQDDTSDAPTSSESGPLGESRNQGSAQPTTPVAPPDSSSESSPAEPLQPEVDAATSNETENSSNHAANPEPIEADEESSSSDSTSGSPSQPVDSNESTQADPQSQDGDSPSVSSSPAEEPGLGEKALDLGIEAAKELSGYNDAVNAIDSFEEGNYSEAALSAAMIIPWGKVLKAAKWGMKGAKAAAAFGKASKASTGTLKRIAAKLGDETGAIGDDISDLIKRNKKAKPRLKPLHPESSLKQSKLDGIRKTDTDQIKKSLEPGLPNSLKVKPDGTVMDGHHRIKVLEERGVDVNSLPRDDPY